MAGHDEKHRGGRPGERCPDCGAPMASIPVPDESDFERAKGLANALWETTYDSSQSSIAVLMCIAALIVKRAGRTMLVSTSDHYALAGVTRFYLDRVRDTILARRARAQAEREAN